MNLPSNEAIRPEDLPHGRKISKKSAITTFIYPLIGLGVAAVIGISQQYLSDESGSNSIAYAGMSGKLLLMIFVISCIAVLGCLLVHEYLCSSRTTSFLNSHISRLYMF